MLLTKILIRLWLITCLILPFGFAFAQINCNNDEASKKSCGVGERCVVDDVSHIEDEFTRRIHGWPYCRADISEIAFSKGCLSHDPLSEGSCLIEWNGPIKRENSQAMTRFLRSLPEFNNPLSGPMFNVTSDGGNVQAAIELGRQLRKNNAKVSVVDRCASACVLLLAGGVRRTTFQGEVVIHRPYSLDTSRTDLADAQDDYDKTNKIVAEFLRDMNLPSSILDAMLRVPPHKGRRLSESELESFGLNERDPVYEQAFNAFAAKKRGLTMTDYLSRKQQEENCLASNLPPRNASQNDYLTYYSYCSSVWE